MLDINWNPSQKELQKFGFVMLIGSFFIGILIWMLYRNLLPAIVAWAVGTVVGVVGLTGSVFARLVYLTWMAMAWLIGNIVSRILLLSIFFLVITTLAIIVRCTRRDRLNLKHKATQSWWIPVDATNTAEDYEKQF